MSFAFTASDRVQIYNIYIINYIDTYASVMYPGMKPDERNNSWVTFLMLILTARISLYYNITIMNKINIRVNSQRGINKDTTKILILSKRFIIYVSPRTQGVV